jgi:SAM-dependent methyltransferase
MSDNGQISERVQNFYERHPYPRPVEDLDDYRQLWNDESRRRADFHLHWPHNPYREDISVLVAGCGTSQAAKHAIRIPAAQVVGIDISRTSIQHTLELKRKYQLENLEVHQLSVERVGELGTRFDKIVSTGVLHHLPDPDAGLRALREVLKPDGAMHLMVYGAYGRAGVYMLQDYARLLGVGDTDQEISVFAETLMALPLEHPLARLLGESPDFRTKAGLADALLNPQDRAYTVPQLFELISTAGLKFGRWIRQAPYIPGCGAFAETPHAKRLVELSRVEQYTAMELLRGTMTRHNLIVYRDDAVGTPSPIFEGNDWLDYVPIRLPGTICAVEKLPPGVDGVLINQNHTDKDIILPINALEKRVYETIDGFLTIEEISSKISIDQKSVGLLSERLWKYDQIVFDKSAVKPKNE